MFQVHLKNTILMPKMRLGAKKIAKISKKYQVETKEVSISDNETYISTLNLKFEDVENLQMFKDTNIVILDETFKNEQFLKCVDYVIYMYHNYSQNKVHKFRIDYEINHKKILNKLVELGYIK